MNIFIVIPFYNEEKHIAKVLKEVSEYAASSEQKLPIVVVDDGSTDNSRLKIKDCKLKNLTVLTHKINLGKGAAMKTGADYAFAEGADAVIFMDGDNQHSAEDLRKFLELLKLGKFDVIFGTRNYSYGVPLVRFLGNKFASVVLAILFNIYVSDVLCGFKALTKKAYKKIRWDSSGYGVETEMVVRTGKSNLKFNEVPVQSIYHDKTKGVTVLDAFGILFEVVKWKLTL
jgi:glycosyltransferase involved in cell wall biosynthesis